MSQGNSSTELPKATGSLARQLADFPEGEHPKTFNDPIHGTIVLHPLLVKIIDTPQFQRLRHIKQLGGVYYVYPGASHNRFEHSLGVSHLAYKLLCRLDEKQPELKITRNQALCVMIAGLCHNLGHGPFSYLWYRRFLQMDIKNSKKAMSEMSSEMLSHLIDENKLSGEFRKYGLVEDIKFIKELIAPPEFSSSYKHPQGFLYEIVANKRNGVDVDKWDYFRRDCHHLGIGCTFDVGRATESARVLGEQRDSQICYNIKDAENMYEMFRTHHTLHLKAYQHKTSNAIECMIAEALRSADPHIDIPGETDSEGKPTKLRMSQCTSDPAAFTILTDEVLQLILISTQPELMEAKALLLRIQKRDIYKCVGHFKYSEDFKTIVETIVEKTHEPSWKGAKVQREDIYLEVVDINFGNDTQDPVKKVNFYTKENPNDFKPIKDFQEQMLWRTLPIEFSDKIVRVYCKSESKFKDIQKWWRDNRPESVDHDELDED